jgi:hypothetical protein
MLAKPNVLELAFCSTRQIWQYYCLMFEASNDWPQYKRNCFIAANLSLICVDNFSKAAKLYSGTVAILARAPLL